MSFEDRELPVAAGSVYGVRQWKYHRRMLRGGYLTGAFRVSWRYQEVYSARCRAHHFLMEPMRPAHPVPSEFCGCGFWAYWNLGRYYDDMEVTGVVEGFGRTLIGTKGFRSEKCRIIALAPVTAWNPPFSPPPVLPGESWQQLKSYYRVPVYSTAEEMIRVHPLTSVYLLK